MILHSADEHGIRNALATCVDATTRRSVHVSHGVFVPGEYGTFPEAASQEGYADKLGQSLPAVESCADLFVMRDAAQRWLLDSRPRDAHNAYPIETHDGRVTFAPRTWFGRPERMRNRRRSVSWFIHCYLTSDETGVLPVANDTLDGLQLGGARNYGFGRVSVADTQCVDLDALAFTTVREADTLQLELLTPYVLTSEMSGADAQSIPW